jgi:hypothetical protein
METFVMKELPARPRIGETKVILGALRQHERTLSEWHWGTGNGILPDLDQVVAGCWDEDAYVFARNLEQRCKWPCNAELVLLLDRISFDEALIKAVQEWVRVNAITVPFKVGDRICTPKHRGATVRFVKEETAEIIILPDDWGPELFDSDADGFVIPCEWAIPLKGILGEHRADPARGWINEAPEPAPSAEPEIWKAFFEAFAVSIRQSAEARGWDGVKRVRAWRGSGIFKLNYDRGDLVADADFVRKAFMTAGPSRALGREGGR